jgi:hypothetical protein
MKIIILFLLFLTNFVCPASSQILKSQINSENEIRVRKSDKTSFKSTGKAVISNTKSNSTRKLDCSKSNGNLKKDVKPLPVNNSSEIVYEKTGDPVQDDINYKNAKKLYLEKHPELKNNKPVNVSRSEYNNLPASRKTVVDSNPSKYNIVD